MWGAGDLAAAGTGAAQGGLLGVSSCKWRGAAGLSPSRFASSFKLSWAGGLQAWPEAPSSTRGWADDASSGNGRLGRQVVAENHVSHHLRCHCGESRTSALAPRQPLRPSVPPALPRTPGVCFPSNLPAWFFAISSWEAEMGMSSELARSLGSCVPASLRFQRAATSPIELNFPLQLEFKYSNKFVLETLTAPLCHLQGNTLWVFFWEMEISLCLGWLIEFYLR